MSFANVTKKGQFEDVGTSSSVVHSAVEECKCVMLCVFLCSSPDQLVKPGWIQQGPWLLRRNSATPTWRGRGGGGWAARPSAANTISHSDLRISLQLFQVPIPNGTLDTFRKSFQLEDCVLPSATQNINQLRFDLSTNLNKKFFYIW